MLKALKISSLVYVVASFVLAIYYLPERVFFIDSAAQIFEIILNRGFAIYVNRYSMGLQQLLPVLAVGTTMPLFAVALLYSLAVPLISLICLWLCLYRYKNSEATIAIILSGTIVGHEFFHAISETTQLIPYVSVFYVSLIAYVKKPSIGKFCVSFIFLFLAYFIHPISILLLGFVFVSIAIQYWSRVRFVFPLFGALLLVFIAKTALTTLGVIGKHDSQFLDQLLISLDELKGIFQSPFVKGIKHVLLKQYLPSIIFFALVVFIVIKKRKPVLLLEVLAAVVFVVVSTIVFRQESTPMAFGARYMPIAFFVAISSRSLFQPDSKSKSLSVLVLALPFFFLGNVVAAGNSYKKRSDLIEKYIALGRKAGYQKYYFQPTNEELAGVDLSWGISIESILRSSVFGKETISIYPRTDLIHTDVLLTDKVYNNVAWWKFRYDQDLNETEYFNIQGNTYPLVNWEEVERINFNGKVQLDSSPYFMSDDRRIVVLSQDKWISGEANVNSKLVLEPEQIGLKSSILLAPGYTYSLEFNSTKAVRVSASCIHKLARKEEGKGNVKLLIPASETWSNYQLSIENIDSTTALLQEITFIRN